MNYLSIFISAFCLVFCLLFFFYIKWYIKRKVSATELLAEYRTEVYRLSAEINAITDRDSMLVEDRIKKLKEILEDTDKRVKVYVQELERSRTGEALYTSLGKGIRAALKTPADIPPSSDHAPELSTQSPKLTLVRQEKAPSDFSVQSPSVLHSASPAAPPAQHEPKQYSKWQIRSQIEELVKENLSPQEIASRLKISITEVEIAMSMMNIKK
jgi:predicted DNA-binding protein YlxM (UPF0122 family)